MCMCAFTTKKFMDLSHFTLGSRSFQLNSKIAQAEKDEDHTQKKREADPDVDLALAVALDDSANDNSDEDFQITGSSPAFSQILALRHCTTLVNSRTKKVKRASKIKDASPSSKRTKGGGRQGKPTTHKEQGVDVSRNITVGQGERQNIENRTKPGELPERGKLDFEKEEKRLTSDLTDCKQGKNRTFKENMLGRNQGCAKNGSCAAKGEDSGQLVERRRPNSVLDGVAQNRAFDVMVRIEPADCETPVIDGFTEINSDPCEKIDMEDGLRSEEIGNVAERNLTESTREWRMGLLERISGDPIECRQIGKRVQIDSPKARLDPKNGTGCGLTSDFCRHLEFEVECRGIFRSEDSRQFTERNFTNYQQEGGAHHSITDDAGSFDEDDLVICTQIERRSVEDLSSSVENFVQDGAAIESENRTKDGWANRKQNIYDILIGNNRRGKTPEHVPEVGDSNLSTEVECDQLEWELDPPGTAMQALADEAELDYEGLGCSDEEGDEGGGSLKCPVCRVDLRGVSTPERELHTNNCLDEKTFMCEARQTGYNLDTDYVEGTTMQGLTDDAELLVVGGAGSNEEEFENSGSLACPICGVNIHRMSASDRELHTNACLDNVKVDETGEVAQVDCNAPFVNRVVKWLEKLNLEKYIELFVKEEIDWDTLQWLTEEDLNILGIKALGPRRKIVCALQDLKRNKTPTSSHEAGNSMIPERPGASHQAALGSGAVDTVQGSTKCITDFFSLRKRTLQRVAGGIREAHSGPKSPGNVGSRSGTLRDGVQRRLGTTTRAPNRDFADDIPLWMCIPGTSFRVDAFKHLLGNCTNWFLTHFHTDHYQGLTRGFRQGKIYCSLITASLVNLRIGVPWDRLQAIPLNETVLIDDVRVTFINANHCPGSIMILFEPSDGKAVLHTGDFRFCSDMITNVALRACRISTLILDTTYCDPQYNFPKQDSVVQFVIDAIQAEAFNPKTLFLIGTYTIGKERIFLEVGKVFQKYVYVGAAKRKLLECMDLSEEDTKWLTTNDQESHIHVVPLWSIASFKRMGSISRHYHGRYNSIVAFSPTGWSFRRDKNRTPGRPGRRYQQGTLIRYEVPYSEHCNFTELREFVQAISPDDIIPSVVSNTGHGVDAMVASLLSEEN